MMGYLSVVDSKMVGDLSVVGSKMVDPPFLFIEVCVPGEQ
jgi:hypothetical protein